MKTTTKSTKLRRPARAATPHTKHKKADPPAEHELEEKPEEGAGNNDEGAGNRDERELPEELREQTPTSDKRPPTNAIPDRPQDPASPSYKEPHPKDRIVNN